MPLTINCCLLVDKTSFDYFTVFAEIENDSFRAADKPRLVASVVTELVVILEEEAGIRTLGQSSFFHHRLTRPTVT